MRFVAFITTTLISCIFCYILAVPQSFTKNIALGTLLSPGQGFWQNTESKSPNLSAEIIHEYLKSPVEVSYDTRMVPHIFAQNEQDLYFVQGYVTASMRLWQMEFQTHATAGRLAEILGHDLSKRDLLVDLDKTSRQKGLSYAAERALKVWEEDPKIKELLDAYTAGVNAYINQLSYADYPLMYKLLNYHPEAWTNLKVALLIKGMANTLTNRSKDFAYTNALTVLGYEQYAALYPDAEQHSIIQDSLHFSPINFKKDSVEVFSNQALLKDPIKEKSPKGVGSNNWAVSGEKTYSGYPILCNDPHLGVTLPSIWFELQLSTPEYSVYGASLPGAPSVIIGFNQDIAWGVTNGAHDVQDWYAINWKDNNRKAYLFNGVSKTATQRIEEIKVRGAQSVYDTIIYTHLGPIYEEGNQDFALRWTLHDPTLDLLAFFKLNKAKNYKDYQNAIKYLSCPAQNIVFASKTGDIALTCQGNIPIHSPNSGRLLINPKEDLDLWQGFIPQNHLPKEYNPKRNYVASANQQSINPSDYPYPIIGEFEEYRGAYLNTVLDTMDNITIDKMQDLQTDNYSWKARLYFPLLMKYLKRGLLSKTELEIYNALSLKEWNYQYEGDSKEATLFHLWFEGVEELLFEEIDTLNSIYDLKGKSAIPRPNHWFVYQLLSKDTAHIFIDNKATKSKENIEDIVTEGFIKACEMLNSEELPIWKEYNQFTLPHLARVGAFGVKGMKVSGVGSALNAVDKRSKNIYAPSWRMIVELSDPIQAYGIYPGGQSENPGSFYYKNMLNDWSLGDYHKLLYFSDKDDYSDRILIKQRYIP